MVLVDGWLEVARAFRAGLELVALYVDGDRDPSRHVPPEASGVYEHSQREQILFALSRPVLEKIAFGKTARSVVAEFRQPQKTFQQLRLDPAPFLLVLDQIEKPGNVGAVFRAADAAGVSAVVVCDGAGDLFNPNAIRSSLGTVFTVPAAVGSYAETQSFLQQTGARVYAARVESSTNLWCVDFRGGVAVVLGSEAWGLGERWQRVGETPISGLTIPMRGLADSLNVSVSAAIIAYEAMRVRGS